MQVGKSLITTHVLPRFFFALLISFIGTGLGGFFIPPGIAMAIGFIPLIVLIALLLKSIFGSGKKRRKGLSAYGMVLPMWLVYLFTLLMGISIYPVIDYYVDSMGAMMVIVAFGVTSALFGGLFLYTYFTKKDFSFLGGILFFSLLSLILVSIVGMFIGSDLFYLVLAWVGVVIFSGYILYDVSRMKKDTFTEKDVPAAVFDLYLNFINLFLDILRILNAFKK